MAMTSIGAFPNRDDPSFKAYLDQYFATILPRFSEELDAVVTAFNNGSLSATSTSSHTINLTAGKVFTVAAGLSFLKGMWVVAISTATADTNNYMVCMVQNYTGTSLTLDPKSFNGTGTIASWRIVIVPPAFTAIAKSEIRLDTGSGTGSVGTYIRNFSTLGVSSGGALSAVVTGANGASITIQSNGIYLITYQEASGTQTFYVSKNQSLLTAPPTISERIITIGPGALIGTRAVELNAGDVLRASASSIPISATSGTFLSVLKLEI